MPTPVQRTRSTAAEASPTGTNACATNARPSQDSGFEQVAQHQADRRRAAQDGAVGVEQVPAHRDRGDQHQDEDDEHGPHGHARPDGERRAADPQREQAGDEAADRGRERDLHGERQAHARVSLRRSSAGAAARQEGIPTTGPSPAGSSRPSAWVQRTNRGARSARARPS